MTPKIKPREIADADLDHEVFHLAYRPQRLEDVIGQDPVVRSLKKVLASKRVPHTFLFTGLSGTGKTTLARIVASMVNCAPQSVLQVDAAINSSVEAARHIANNMQYQAMGEKPNRACIIDECHAMSSSAWKALLVSTEEPPPHAFWLFCTTEPSKVPDTIKTRCHAYDLKAVKWELLAEHVANIAINEDIEIDPTLVEAIARKAEGSVRQALVYLSMVQGVESTKEAMHLIETADNDAQDIMLARGLCFPSGKFGWAEVVGIISDMQQEGKNPESMRIMVTRYATAVLLDPKNARQSERLLAVLSAFSAPFTASDGMGPLLLAVGSLLVRR